MDTICSIPIEVKPLPHYRGLPLPAYQTEGSAGFDLYSAQMEPIDLKPGGRALVPTGLQFALPSGYEMQIRPRSGLALRHGITLLNTPGTVDSDFRGEVQLIVVNLGEVTFRLERGMRLAQAIVARYVQARLTPVADLPATERGCGGFGHTGR